MIAAPPPAPRGSAGWWESDWEIDIAKNLTGEADSSVAESRVKSLAHRPASSVSGHPAAIVRDRRIERTRGALVAAFTALLFERGFSRVTVRDVIARANIGRSTFYEHFENKHDLLEQSLAPVLTPLADVLRTGSADAQLREILDHIWSNRRLTAPMLTGSRALVTRSLVRLFEERLEVIDQ